VIFIFAFVVWTNIVRMGTVLFQYEQILEKSRDAAHGNDSAVANLWLVRNRLPDQVKSGFFSLQYGGEYLVIGTCWLMLVGQLIIGLHLRFPEGERLATLVGTGTLISTSVLFALIISGHVLRKKIRVFQRCSPIRLAMKIDSCDAIKAPAKLDGESELSSG
jgi:hypothetical protein